GAHIAARLQVDDAGRLSVVVGVATRGLDTEVENNSFADLRADPAKPWSLSAAAIKDMFLLSRASQQALLLGLSQKTLLDAARRAQDDGTVYSIAPIRGNAALCSWPWSCQRGSRGKSSTNCPCARPPTPTRGFRRRLP